MDIKIRVIKLTAMSSNLLTPMGYASPAKSSHEIGEERVEVSEGRRMVPVPLKVVVCRFIFYQIK